jgi:hypothetical protein
VKYYLYVSDTKVDMLYGQIPEKLRSRIAGELKIDLKVVQLALKRESSAETRYSKTELVSRYIERHLPVGTVADAKDYFKGVHPMSWGPYGSEDSQVVYFGGADVESNTCFGLGGSINHVIGSTGQSVAYSGIPAFPSLPPYLLYVLAKELQLPGSAEMPDSDQFDEWGEPEPEAVYPRLIFNATESQRRRGAEQQMEFLAKRLLQGEVTKGGIRVLLGSPIYVALAE